MVLKDLGYYFSEVEVYVEELDDNKVNINFDIDLGKKAKIKKISFLEIKSIKIENLEELF